MLSGNELAISKSCLLFAALLSFSVAVPSDAQVPQMKTTIVQPPTGWFGVRISDQALVDERGNAFFDSYPVVTGVDSASPAAKAGVRAGDELVSFNSHDMPGGSVQLTKWLNADAPSGLRIRRNGTTRVVRGTLDRRPENWEQNMVV